MVTKAGCSHSELTAQVVALKAAFDAFKELMAERDRRYEQRSKAQDDAVDAAMVASKEATVTAKTEVDAHLKALNEIRTMSLDQAKTFAVQSLVDEKIESLRAELKGIKETALLRAGATGGMEKAVGYLFGIGGLLIAALAVYLHR